MMRNWTKILPLFVVEWLAWNWPPWDEGKQIAPTVQRRWEYVPGPEGVQFRRLSDRHEDEGEWGELRIDGCICPQFVVDDNCPVHADEPEGDEHATKAEPHEKPRCPATTDGVNQCDRRAGHDGPHRDYFGKEWPTDEPEGDEKG